MSKSLKLLIIFLSLTVISIAQTVKDEEKKIVNSFENYKSAILNDKGKKAIQYIDSKTIDYYNSIIEKVKFLDSASVNALPIFDKLMIFSVRHRSTKKEILSFTGKTLFIYAVEKGMVGKNSVMDNYIGNIIIENDFAQGEFISKGNKTPYYFSFYKENKQWKLNLTSLFSVSETAFKQIINESGLTENDFLFLLLENVSGKKSGLEIWKRQN